VPVPVSLHTGYTTKHFGKYPIIDATDLVPEGGGRSGTHAIVAVAICGKGRGGSLCKFFEEEMRARGVEEGLVFANSWGTHNNFGGYVLITPAALDRVLEMAILAPEDPKMRHACKAELAGLQ
jgi:hypothetical protein